MSEVLLDVRDLEVRFFLRQGVLTAVDRVSFQLRRREILGVVGESGCGKTVMALALMRLVPPPGRIQQGRILYRGEDLRRKPEVEMRGLRGRHIAMIFQEPMLALNPAHTVGKQISECYLIHENLEQGAALRRAAEMLERVGIQNPGARLHSYPHQLSGGMAQRVVIAMALACDPDILIADEPTTALDVTVQAQILALLRELLRESGKAMIFITHDLGVASVLCHRVAVMYAGSMVELAPCRALFENPMHPYTQGLLRALPRRHRKQERLQPIPGNLCSLIGPPGGCKFHPRCPQVMDICSREDPRDRPRKGEGLVRCHLH